MAALQDLLGFINIYTVLLCSFILLALRWFLGRPKNLPPGPWGLPIIGSTLAIARGLSRGLEPHDLFLKYAAKYGPVFHLKILNKSVVVLSNYSAAKEAFQHPQLADRPKMMFSEILQSEGVASLSGEPWLELRRFSLNVLRGFGVGKSVFAEQIGTEAEELMKMMSAHNGKPFNPKSQLVNAVANVICAVVLGERYEYTDEEFIRLQNLLGRNVELLGAGAAIIIFPALRYLPFVPTNDLIANLTELRDFAADIIKTHRASFDANNLKDFTDTYLMEIRKNEGKRKEEVKYGHLTEGRFVGSIINLFAAGSETTATTLQWCLLYMIVNPDIQKRVQDEIDEVVGRNRLPRMTDKPELNFTRAVIWEVQRIAMVTPLPLPHLAAKDTKFRGFEIPKGTLVIANLWAVERDPKVWSDPDQFKPERFLNDKGEAVQADELIPFSTGRRSCIGEHLAMMELFIFFTYLMHQFTFKKPDNSPSPTLKGKSGFTYSPAVFDICAIKRD